MPASPPADWIARFPELGELDEADRMLLTKHARRVELPAGQVIFSPGTKPENFLLVLDGTVRVQQVSAGGREIVLYRVSGGESCIMTTACLLSEESYLAEGITETPVTAIAIGRADFDDLIGRSSAFRRLVFSRYATRITDLQRLVENVAFERMDKRLARKILELADGRDSLDITHQALAIELGTAREVVSRVMKEFARRGWVEAGRGEVEITDRQALADLARE